MARINLKYVASLVDDARLQDSNAFAGLFAITYQEQYNLAYSYLWDKALVQDTLLDIYLNALHSINRLDESKNFIRWLSDMNIEACEILADAMDIEPPKGRPKIPPYPFEDAERMLEFIFFEEGRKPNSLPLAAIAEYNEYRMQQYGLQKMIVLFIILSFVVAPVFTITPEFSLKQDKNAAQKGQLKYTFTVDSFVPIDTVKATIDGKDTPVYQDGKRSYYIIPTTNGSMEVTTTFITRRHTTESEVVTAVDRRVPEFLKSNTENGKVYLYVRDTGSFINWNAIYGLDENNNKVDPLSHNGITGEVIFSIPDVLLNVYIPDRAGNTLHLVINHN